MIRKARNVYGQTHLQKRGSQYYFRIRIPLDLLPHYDGKRELKASLRTADKREATRMCQLRALEANSEFDRLRHQHATAHGRIPPRRITHIDQAFIDQFRTRWLHEVLANDDAWRSAGINAEEFAELQAQTEETQKALQTALARGDTAQVAPALHGMLHLLGIELDVTEADYRRLAYAYLQTLAQGTDLIRRRNAGEVVDTRTIVTEDNAYPLTPATTGKPGLLALHEYWRCAAPRPQKTSDTYLATVKLFIDIVGDKPADQLRKADFVLFKDRLQERQLHHKTVANKLVHLKAILNHAVANDKLEANPASAVRVAKPKIEALSRLPFDADDLKILLACPLYVSGERPKAGAGEAAAWLPLLALYSGARENELGQLLVGDVLKDPVAGYYLNIIDEPDGESRKTVKTAGSRRKVPLHPELVKAGFIRYRDHIAKSGSERLFPELKPDRHGHATGNWSKWFGRYLRGTIGITDPRKVFHSFRHTFKDACRDAGLPEDVHDALTGHVNDSVSRGYGSGHSLKVLAQAMAKIKYPGLGLPLLIPPPPNPQPPRRATQRKPAQVREVGTKPARQRRP